jgi:medium-chain acyl-[acyl-carrier-protein] hydrolase
MNDTPSRWFIREVRVPAPACRVFCFPYAGGSASIYRGWHAGLPSSAELLAVELPGRGAHFAATPIPSLTRLAARLADAIAPLMDAPAVFFGHSNGALMSYALTLELSRRGLPSPQRILLSAKRPPHLDCRAPVHALPTPQFVERLRTLNGTPPEILSNPDLLELFLPALRADFAISETYRHEPCAPLACRAALIGSEDDADVSLSQLREWDRYFVDELPLHVIEGDHFFVHSARDAVLRILRRYVQDCIAAASPWRQG